MESVFVTGMKNWIRYAVLSFWGFLSQTNVDFVNREVFAQKGSYLFRYYKERNMITYFWCDVFENVE